MDAWRETCRVVSHRISRLVVGLPPVQQDGPRVANSSHGHAAIWPGKGGEFEWRCLQMDPQNHGFQYKNGRNFGWFGGYLHDLGNLQISNLSLLWLLLTFPLSCPTRCLTSAVPECRVFCNVAWPLAKVMYIQPVARVKSHVTPSSGVETPVENVGFMGFSWVLNGILMGNLQLHTSFAELLTIDTWASTSLAFPDTMIIKLPFADKCLKNWSSSLVHLHVHAERRGVAWAKCRKRETKQQLSNKTLGSTKMGHLFWSPLISRHFFAIRRSLAAPHLSLCCCAWRPLSWALPCPTSCLHHLAPWALGIWLEEHRKPWKANQIRLSIVVIYGNYIILFNIIYILFFGFSCLLCLCDDQFEFSCQSALWRSGLVV